MARGYFKCAECGDQVSVNVGKNRKDTDRYCEWLESQGRLCSDCEEKERQAANAKAAEANASAGLPAMTGTDKQIAWAETIRADKLETIRKARAGELSQMYVDAFWGTYRGLWCNTKTIQVDDPTVDYAYSLLIGQTSASWWIDNREIKIGMILTNLFIATPPAVEAPPEVQDAKAAALIEATIRPASPKTETVAEIRVHETSVEVIFPEKRDDFWQIIKKQLHYEWSGSAWKRSLGITNGTPADRAAEAGNFLLSAGFIIRIFDQHIREAAVNGTYEHEHTRWIMKRTKGDYAGWFAINWPEREERLYNAARKLKRSKYDKPSVVVPPEQFEEVLDFAGLYGFRLSEGAQEVVDQTRQARDAAMVAIPVKVESHRPPVPGDKPEKLVVPESVEVADEFKD